VQCSRLASHSSRHKHRHQPTPRGQQSSSSPSRQDKYEKEFAPAAIKTIKDSGGRFIVRGGEVTSLAGDAPKRVVITGWESLDDVKKWQAGEYGKLIALRDQVAKVRQFAVATCENPQGAKPGQTKCPF
jgi:uncharacterized protein (DUF1330 family)